MKILKWTLIFSFGLFLLSGCAANFKSINPQTIKYKDIKTERDLPVAYQYDLMELANNKKYFRKANEANVNLVAVEITNSTDSILNVSDDIIF